ncbi:MAG: DUF1573 domain-containing protein [Deltaproteobacteria bacterium]|nr:DUF1573 domain-containing protein [Deltaproteobacteria bacterium]
MKIRKDFKEMTRINLLLFSIISLIILSSCSGSKSSLTEDEISSDVVYNPNTADGQADTNLLPRIEFENDLHDFGRIIQGEIVSYSFKFKNTGKSDLVIATVSASCGCTVPKYPKTPLKPGEQGSIVVSFNSQGRKGFQHKKLAVISNTQPNHKIIEIKAMVYIPEE